MIVLFIALCVLMAADAYMTIRALHSGSDELNPLLRIFVILLGVEAGIVLPKVAIMLALWVYLDDIPLAFMLAVTGFYAYWAARGFK